MNGGASREVNAVGSGGLNAVGGGLVCVWEGYCALCSL